MVDKRINMDIPEELWKQVSIQAAIEGLQKRELVIKALERYLVEMKEEGK